MAELRWVLLVAALLVLAVVFLWTRYRNRLAERLKLPFHGSAGGYLPAPGNRQEPALSATSGAPVLPAKIVTIRILSRGATPFPAEQLVLALREAGLRHGRYGIFHHFPSDVDDEPVFSAASLTEPGSFDLAKLRTDVYQGISLFLGLPGPVEGVSAFDSMVTAARAIAKRLDGNLVDEHGSTLSVQRERYLREEVIQYQHRHGRPA
ncbi:MAG: cell division protein ZipA C-terminal FtsZ-binding domain-containing protein [Gammaproteobacteria bacterium]|nr:cell division protein ZipA C-terminal FtsZ-binding domain-containing protein [Gammaproteobacteria bacterium]